MKPEDLAQGVMAGGIIMMLISLSLAVAYVALFFVALIGCLKNQQGIDRLTWVIVIIAVPLVGPILYYTMANKTYRQLTPQGSPPPIDSPGHGKVSPIPNPSFDHHAMKDDKMRAAAISEALLSSSAPKRPPRA